MTSNISWALKQDWRSGKIGEVVAQLVECLLINLLACASVGSNPVTATVRSGFLPPLSGKWLKDYEIGYGKDQAP